MNRIKKLFLSHLKAMRRINSFVYTPVTKKILLVLVPVSIIVTQTTFVTSYILGQNINTLAHQTSIFGSNYVIGILAIVGWSIVARAFRFIAMRKQSLFRKEIAVMTELGYWKAYAHLDIQDRENPEVQDAVSNAMRNYTSVMDTFFTQWDMVGAIITIATSITLLSVMEWWYLLVLMAMVAPSLYATRTRKTKSYKQQNRLNELKRYGHHLTFNLDTKETLINGTTGYFLSLYESIRKKLIAMEFKLTFKIQNINFTADVWSLLLYGILYYHIFHQVEKGLIEVGAVFVAFNAISQLQENLSTVMNKVVDLEDQVRRANDFFLILDFEPTIKPHGAPKKVDPNTVPLIEFDNVWFKYPDTENYVLKGLTFKINPGERIGLVGENGSGKTTISLLLLRLYDPDKGSVRINGIDLRVVDRESLFAITGAVFQDFSLFMTRCSEMIRSYDVKKYDYEGIVNAAKAVGIHDFIESLPEKYDQKVGRFYKKAMKLSGGQRQKFAIASLLYRDPKLIILDELTSALSPTAEDQVVKHYAKVSKGKTCLVICQRYKSLEFVDRIIVLKDGTVAENGTHKELIMLNGHYSELFNLAQLKVV